MYVVEHIDRYVLPFAYRGGPFENSVVKKMLLLGFLTVASLGVEPINPIYIKVRSRRFRTKCILGRDQLRNYYGDVTLTRKKTLLSSQFGQAGGIGLVVVFTSKRPCLIANPVEIFKIYF